jgi:hypothetical protein
MSRYTSGSALVTGFSSPKQPLHAGVERVQMEGRGADEGVLVRAGRADPDPETGDALGALVQRGKLAADEAGQDQVGGYHRA